MRAFASRGNSRGAGGRRAAPRQNHAMEPTSQPPPSSPKQLLWLALGLAALVVALVLFLGDAWWHWFPDP